MDSTPRLAAPHRLFRFAPPRSMVGHVTVVSCSYWPSPFSPTGLPGHPGKKPAGHGLARQRPGRAPAAPLRGRQVLYRRPTGGPLSWEQIAAPTACGKSSRPAASSPRCVLLAGDLAAACALQRRGRSRTSTSPTGTTSSKPGPGQGLLRERRPRGAFSGSPSSR